MSLKTSPTYHPTDSQVTSPFSKDYDDERYSYFEYGKLRVDRIHPSVAGHQWLAILIIYRFLSEWNDMQFYLNTLNDTNYDKIFHQNKAWISPKIRSLPPFLTIDPMTQQLYAFLANHRTKQLVALNFDEMRQRAMNHGKLVVHNEGPGWKLIVENNSKQGLICEDIGCHIILNLTNALNVDTMGNGHSIMVAVSYLVSYENMGRACIWIDDRYDTSKCNTTEGIEYQIIDGLISEHLSVSRMVHWQLNQQLNDLYFHVSILDSGRPPEERNKFKIINLKLLQMK